MKSVSNDAQAFVEGVMNHISRRDESQSVTPKVHSLLLKMSSNAKREHQATVQSAVKLTLAEVQLISSMLSGLAGHQVSLNSEVEPSLIGGLRVTMGDWVMDTSIKSELEQMAKLLVL